MAARAWASVKSSGSRLWPSLRHRRARTKRSSSSARGHYLWAKPTVLYSWVAARLFFAPGDADQDQAHVGAVVLVAQIFEHVRTETFGFIKDEQFNVLESDSRWPVSLPRVSRC